MTENAVLDLIEQQRWMEPVEDQLQKGVHNAFHAVPNGRRVKNFLHGVWLGHPLHPVLTDIPIGSWTAMVVLDAADSFGGHGEYGRGADAALTVGLTGAVAAAITGLTDWQDTDDTARRIGLTHGLLNLTAASLFGASLVMRKRGQRTGGRLVSLLGYAISLGAAYLGGNLVYRKQIGVNHSLGQPYPADFTPVLAERDLLEGELRRVEADGARILLLRRAGRIYAIAEVCSHLGGPLAEGHIDGQTVQCPWHASRFSLEDGSVIDGPATHPQPCFEARVRDGQIEVRIKTRP